MSNSVPVLIQISSLDEELMKHYLGIFNAKKMTVHVCDTVAGWWNLNQDWLEFQDNAECDWGWVRPLSLTEEEWQAMYKDLSAGKLVMMVHYMNSNGELEPHH